MRDDSSIKRPVNKIEIYKDLPKWLITLDSPDINCWYKIVCYTFVIWNIFFLNARSAWARRAKSIQRR